MSDDIKPGSGFTTTSIVNKLVQVRVNAYVTTLKGIGRMAPSKKALADLEAGFRDGMRDMVSVLVGMEVITLVDDKEGDK